MHNIGFSFRNILSYKSNITKCICIINVSFYNTHTQYSLFVVVQCRKYSLTVDIQCHTYSLSVDIQYHTYLLSVDIHCRRYSLSVGIKCKYSLFNDIECRKYSPSADIEADNQQPKNQKRGENNDNHKRNVSILCPHECKTRIIFRKLISRHIMKERESKKHL